MLTENRKYNYIGELIVKRSVILDKQIQPKDDVVNWLFLNIENHLYSFVYKIKNPGDAKYGSPFLAEIAVTMIERVKEVILLNKDYEVLRGQEKIGTIRIVDSLDLAS